VEAKNCASGGGKYKYFIPEDYRAIAERTLILKTAN
jgi:hypothetical protein